MCIYRGKILSKDDAVTKKIKNMDDVDVLLKVLKTSNEGLYVINKSWVHVAWNNVLINWWYVSVSFTLFLLQYLYYIIHASFVLNKKLVSITLSGLTCTKKRLWNFTGYG